MATMRAVQVSKPNGPLELVERPIPEPGPGTVRIKVEACGICHSDTLSIEGKWPGISYPRIPGHEVAGVVDEVGSGVTQWTKGQRVGVGWYGGCCNVCQPCRRGENWACVTHQVTGITFDGGYAEYMLAPANAVAMMPADIPAIEAAPLLCAGITTFNALRNSGARPGDLVAVLGLGGLGHLGVQYAKRMGFHTVAIARGEDKDPLAKQLGADVYIDSRSQDVSQELQKLGGARVVLATVIAADAMAATQAGLGLNGTLMIVGAVNSMEISPIGLITGRSSIKGWYSGTAVDSEDTLNFSSLTGVRSMNEIYPLEKAAEAYERMMSGKARFRVVLTTGK
ncbi:MAG: alcohol dehydrogenase [Pirellulales bacterium]